MGSKYGNRKLTAPDGQKFDSVKEFHRWGCLRLLERAGEISNLKRQVKFELIPKQVVEDCKGMKTEVYRIKKKLMLWVHGIRIKET